MSDVDKAFDDLRLLTLRLAVLLVVLALLAIGGLAWLSVMYL